MDRITRKLANGSIEFVDGKGYASLSHIEGIQLLFERLFAYEETGLSPSDIVAMKEKDAAVDKEELPWMLIVYGGDTLLKMRTFDEENQVDKAYDEEIEHLDGSKSKYALIQVAKLKAERFQVFQAVKQ